MHFTAGLAALVLAATRVGVYASPVEARQETPRIYARFYSDTGCNGEWIDDTVWLQEPVGTCINVGAWTTFQSTLVVNNYATRTLRAYSASNCPGSGVNYFDVQPGQTGCFAQNIASVQFL